MEENKQEQIISLEGISTTEKHFLNFVRNFKGEEWLVDLIQDSIHEAVTELVMKSVEDEAIQSVVEDVHSKGITDENAYNYFQCKVREIFEDEERISNLSESWNEQVLKTITGELAPIEDI